MLAQEAYTCAYKKGIQNSLTLKDMKRDARKRYNRWRAIQKQTDDQHLLLEA